MGLRPLLRPLASPRSTPLVFQLAAFRIRSAFRKSRRLGSGRLAILRHAWVMSTGTPRVLRKPCFLGKSFEKSPAPAILSPFEHPAQWLEGRRSFCKQEANRNTAARLQLPTTPNAPCCRSTSPGAAKVSTPWLVSSAHLKEKRTARGAGYPTRRLFPKAERDGMRRVGTAQRGCRRGMEGGAPWGGSPKQHPPSPVWKTHH